MRCLCHSVQHSGQEFINDVYTKQDMVLFWQRKRWKRAQWVFRWRLSCNRMDILRSITKDRLKQAMTNIYMYRRFICWMWAVIVPMPLWIWVWWGCLWVCLCWVSLPASRCCPPPPSLNQSQSLWVSLRGHDPTSLCETIHTLSFKWFPLIIRRIHMTKGWTFLCI